MLFRNNCKSFKIRIGNINNHYWKTVKNGDLIDLPEKVGKELKLEIMKDQKIKQDNDFVTIESDLNNKEKIETKLIKVDESFKEELISIKGIGKKTVKDILIHYPNKRLLLNNLNNLGLRDDIELKLRKYYDRIND